MNINPMQLIQLIKNGGNPQQLVMSFFQQSGANNNPILNNAMNLMQNGNRSALEMIARNIAQQKGLDFDKEFNNFQNYFK